MLFYWSELPASPGEACDAWSAAFAAAAERERDETPAAEDGPS